MPVYNKIIQVTTHGQGLYEISDQVNSIINSEESVSGLCTVFVQHTSASLIIQENADPSVKRDLEKWLNRLVKENDELYSHTAEGPDDMPAHIKSVLTATSIAIPLIHGVLSLGTWQGIYLWEHRKSSHRRKIIVNVMS